MKDVINLAVVNFRTLWGKKGVNLNRIVGYVEAAAKQGADMVVFPEMALTGYDDVESTPQKEKMQTIQAETIPGPSTDSVCEVAKKYGVYAMFGMPECVDENRDVIYNSVAIVTPEGNTLCYRKVHLPLSEPNWASRGDVPMIFETPWGPVGLGICYDVYKFPELIRGARAKGARIFINCTAFGGDMVSGKLLRSEIENDVAINSIFVASANLTGLDHDSTFHGCSHICGPTGISAEVSYYTGKPLDAGDDTLPGIRMAAIDLTMATQNTIFPIFETNEITGEPDLRPELYRKWFDDVCKDDAWKRMM